MVTRRQPSAPRRRGRPRSADAHQAILRASIALVREVGYDALAMEAIAVRAGVGKATVYRRWKSKELLVAEALERIMLSIPVPDTGTLRGDLDALMRDQTGLYLDPATAGLLSGLVAAMARSERIARAVRGGFVEARREATRQVLLRGIERRELPARLDVELAVDLLSAPMFYRLLATGTPIDARFSQGVVDVLLEGLTAATTRRRRR